MKHTLNTMITAVVAAGAVALSTVSVLAQKTGHLDEALILSAQIANKAATGVFTNSAGAKLNEYGRAWTATSNTPKSGYVLEKTGSPATNLTTCAPLISRLLQNKFNWKWNNYSFYDPVKATNVTTASPAPYQMIALMNAGKGFTNSTTRLADALRGDVLLFSRPDNVADDHAALFIAARWDSAVEYPSGLADSDADLEGSYFVEIEILDSTGGTLHSEDSRRIEYPAGVFTNTRGVGTGVMGVLVDENGNILGHTWSLPTNGDPNSDDDDERNDWVRNLNGRLEFQTGDGARTIVFGRLAL